MTIRGLCNACGLAYAKRAKQDDDDAVCLVASESQSPPSKNQREVFKSSHSSSFPRGESHIANVSSNFLYTRILT